MGKRPRAITRWRVRSDADRLVETLARCGENGKQRREWRCLLSGLEPARLKYLYQDRQITASGHETTDTDPGTATTKDDYSLETYLLSTNHYQIELLTNLDQVPESGDRCRQFSKT